VLLAVAAVLALAIATVVRRSAPAIAIVIVVTVVPYLFAFHPGSQPQGSGPGGGGGWPLQITPAAALSVQQAVPQFHQLLAVYPLDNGYYPLAAWAGLAVECAWAAAALALAYYLLRRRDA
jgi:ABC-type transport system involved in multi-copper enzyme maturation permease subunit